MKRIFLNLLLVAILSPAFAQSGTSVKQSGNVTPGQVPWWITSGVIGGGVTAADSPISSFGATGPICSNSARQSSGAWSSLCFQANTSSAAVISLQNYGGAAPQALSFSVNGNLFVIGGAQTITGPLTINPPAGTATQGIVITQTGPLTGPVPAPANFDFNLIQIEDQSATAAVNDFTNGLRIIMSTGTSNLAGSKATTQFVINHFLPSNTGADLIAMYARCQSTARNGGTGIGATGGTCFAASLVAQLSPNGSSVNPYFFTLSGAEIDVQIDTGAYAQNRLGLSVIATGNNKGGVLDIAFETSGNTTQWDCGYCFTSLHGSFGVSTTGTAIGVPDGIGATIATAIDFSPLTLTYLLKGPNSFSIDGGGNIAAKSLALTTSGGIGLVVADGTVTGIAQPTTLFTHSFEIGTTTNHNLDFITNNVLAGYFDTSQIFHIGSNSVRAAFQMDGFTSGSVKQTVPDVVGGSAVITWGSSTGTPAVSATSPLSIATATGVISCATCLTPSSVTTTPVAVGSLPTCNSGAKSTRSFVTDSNAASYTAGIGAVVAAGGSTNVPVVCDGTNWRIGANDNVPAHALRKYA